MSVTLEMRIDSFISEHGLEKTIKDDLCCLITGCFEDMFKHLLGSPVPPDVKVQKILKNEKKEDIASMESKEQLGKCTSASMNQYCKDHNLRVGGTKKEIVDRIWRFHSGESSDEDTGRVIKVKKPKEPSEHHTCCGKKTNGDPCSTGANENLNGQWFCWRHIEDAKINAQLEDNTPEPEQEPVKEKKIISKKKPVSDSEQEPEQEQEPVKIKKISKKKKLPENELVSE